jgi:hypothetical protein
VSSYRLSVSLVCSFRLEQLSLGSQRYSLVPIRGDARTQGTSPRTSPRTSRRRNNTEHPGPLPDHSGNDMSGTVSGTACSCCDRQVGCLTPQPPLPIRTTSRQDVQTVPCRSDNRSVLEGSGRRCWVESEATAHGHCAIRLGFLLCIPCIHSLHSS